MKLWHEPQPQNTLRTEGRMQELVLIRPSHAANSEESQDAAEATGLREFEERLAGCGPLAYRVARGVLRNAADAEDVAQETLLRAFRRFNRLRDNTRFRAWLVRISFRLALDRVRSTKRREHYETVWAAPGSQPPAANAEELAASSEFQRQLNAAVDALPKKLRLVLLLSAMEGYSTEEVAGMLGVPTGTVKSRLFMARKQLAEKLRWYVNATKKR